jgi:hypothetical protein
MPLLEEVLAAVAEARVIGLAGVLPSGWLRGSQKGCRRSSASTTVFHSRCNTSSSTGCRSIGHLSLKISSAIGRLTKTSMSILCATAAPERPQPDQGNPRWRRVTELRARTAKSEFHFDVQGSVAKSTHAGIPWLRYIRLHTEDHAHFWPFDGWSVPPNRSVVAEVYPALWSRTFPNAGRTLDQRDAFDIARWLQRADSNGSLEKFLCPEVSRISARRPRLRVGFSESCRGVYGCFNLTISETIRAKRFRRFRSSCESVFGGRSAKSLNSSSSSLPLSLTRSTAWPCALLAPRHFLGQMQDQFPIIRPHLGE